MSTHRADDLFANVLQCRTARAMRPRPPQRSARCALDMQHHPVLLRDLQRTKKRRVALSAALISRLQGAQELANHGDSCRGDNRLDPEAIPEWGGRGEMTPQLRT